MGYEIGWLVEKRVVLLKASGDVTLKEALAVDQQFLALLNSASSPLYLLADFTAVRTIPPVRILMSSLQTQHHPYNRLTLAYGVNSFVLTLLITLVSLFGYKLRTFRTREDALKFLKILEPDLLEMGML